MKTKIIITFIGLILASCGSSVSDNGTVPGCDELDSANGEQIAKAYLKGSWVYDYPEKWGTFRFKYDGANQLKHWVKKKGGNNWSSTGTYTLLKVKKFTHTSKGYCSEYLFDFYNASDGKYLSMYVEGIKGVTYDSGYGGRSQYVHYKN